MKKLWQCPVLGERDAAVKLVTCAANNTLFAARKHARDQHKKAPCRSLQHSERFQPRISCSSDAWSAASRGPAGTSVRTALGSSLERSATMQRDCGARSRPAKPTHAGSLHQRLAIGVQFAATPLAHLDVELTTAVEHVVLAFTPPVLLLSPRQCNVSGSGWEHGQVMSHPLLSLSARLLLGRKALTLRHHCRKRCELSSLDDRRPLPHRLAYARLIEALRVQLFDAESLPPQPSFAEPGATNTKPHCA